MDWMAAKGFNAKGAKTQSIKAYATGISVQKFPERATA